MTITSHHRIWENDTTNRDRDAYRILLVPKKKDGALLLSNYREHIDVNVFNNLRGYNYFKTDLFHTIYHCLAFFFLETCDKLS